MKSGKLIILLTAGLLAAFPVVAKDKKHKDHKSEAKEASPKADAKPAREAHSQPVAKVTISTSEREAIQKFMAGKGQSSFTTPVANNSRNLPPGLAKNAARGKALPPGWQKKMECGQIIPVEVYEHCKPLPPELVVKLPPPPKGVITVTIEGKVVRLLEATREILDVFDILPR